MVYFGIAAVAFVIGGLIGAGVVGFILKCNHAWEKIIDDKNTCHHVVVHRCTKCGRITKTRTSLYG